MGLSSSQARLLSLTGRMHDIEYKAQNLEAQKLQMANESKHVYQEYENALNKSKIQLKQLSADGSAEYIDATYNNMLDAGYYIQYANNNTLWGLNGPIRDGKIYVKNEDVELYNKAKNNEDLFVALKMGLTGATLSTDHNTKGYQEIYTAEQLSQISGTGNYILMADIDMSNTTTWTPKNFNGHLNGNGHTITGLKSSLFNELSSNAKIENLKLSNVNINSYQGNMGAIAYTSSGAEISNVSVSGTIKTTGHSSIGGIIGEAKNGTYVHDVTVNANISGATYRAGGIIGGITEGSDNRIENAVFIGSVEATNGNSTHKKAQAGGIVGEVYGNTDITNCYAEGDIYAKTSGTSEHAAGIVGLKSQSGVTLNITNSNSNTNERVEDTGSIDDIIAGGGANISNTISPTKEGAKIKINEVLKNDEFRYIFKKIAAGEYYTDNEENPVNGNENSSEWFSNMLNAGLLYIFKKDKNNDEFYQTNVATDTSLQEISDKTELKKAEAKYEADMRKINQKDKKFDTDLAALDAERNAIKTEMETLKSVAKDNVERTFKLFG